MFPVLLIPSDRGSEKSAVAAQFFLGRSPWFTKLEFSDSRLCRGVARGEVPTYPFLLFCVHMWLPIFRPYDVCVVSYRS